MECTHKQTTTQGADPSPLSRRGGGVWVPSPPPSPTFPLLSLPARAQPSRTTPPRHTTRPTSAHTHCTRSQRRTGRRGRPRDRPRPPRAGPPPPPPKTTPFGLVSVCGLLTELEDVGRVVALVGYGHEARRLPFLCTSLARDDELLVATRTAVYGEQLRTRLMYAARTGDVRRVTVLLRPRGAEREVDEIDAEFLTALHHASASGRVETVRLLLDKGADEDAEADGRWRPLHYASALGHAGVVALLLDRDALTDADDDENEDEDEENPFHEEPLHVACEHGHVDIVRLLLDAGSYKSAWDDDRCTPYIVAVKRGQEAVVTFLLDGGQQVDGTADDGIDSGHTALCAAAWYKQESMARLLLDKGADVNAVNRAGSTPLHAAAWSGSVALTRLFLSRGADPKARAGDGRTPLDAARQQLVWAAEKAPVDPLEVQKLSEIVGIYEALDEQQEVKEGGE
jgi:ankyrin repeat protein